MIAADELKTSLSHFTGTTRYIRDPFTGLMHTDGIAHLAECAGAEWLISDIGAVFRHHPQIRKGIPFQLWTLTVSDEHTAVLTCREDCDMPVIFQQNYSYTDFPAGTWKMYLIDGVLMVPSEY
jgi:hypothetical protein